ncbi:MAG: cation:proton antiporter [Ilumatobacteraceae bacterium]|nr:cation:proton antiporter [Ilumatobacteraceae bacterium]
MSAGELAIIAGAICAYALVSRRLAGSWLSAPMVFLAVGLLVGPEVLGLVEVGAANGVVKLLAEATLAFVLFTDASGLDTRRLRHQSGMPIRLLVIGLPLTIVAGMLVADVMFGALVLGEALALAVLLAPTDAALGQAVVSDERLPIELRQGLNVESGLNDGICVPLLFAAIALAEVEEAPTFEGEVITDLLSELAVAVAIGFAVAVAVTLLRNLAHRAGWIDGHWARIIPLTAAVMAYTITTEAGGSGFIASFVAGLVYGIRLPDPADRSVELVEEVGDLLSVATFLMFAIVLVGPVLSEVGLDTVVYAVLSLTVIRMLPVAIALIGTGSRLPTVLFAGWFGPRGLASIVFVLVVVEESGMAAIPTIVEVATVTVVLSVVAHGVSAPFLVERYAAWTTTQGGDQPANAAS